MSKLVKYVENERGTYNIIVEDVDVPHLAQEVLNIGGYVRCDVDIPDGQHISKLQRRKIFALINDIYDYTGQPHEDLRKRFQFYLEMIYGYEPISLSNCSMKIASQLINLIIEWVFLHNIPLRYATGSLLKEDKAFLYYCCINRICCITGKPGAELAHYTAVGTGRNRRKISHLDNYILPLSHELHQEQHMIGMTEFNKKYHLENSWIKVDDRLNKILKGSRENGRS